MNALRWMTAASAALACVPPAMAQVDSELMARAFPAAAIPARVGDFRIAQARELAAKALGDDVRDLVFVPITPCTVWDTRFATEPQSAGLIASGQTKRFFSHDGAAGNYTTWGGNPSCPETLEAAIGGHPFAALMTVYINDATSNGWLTLYRDGDPDPSNATISVYYSAGPTRTQTVISKSSRGYGAGAFDVAATSRFGSVNASASVTGYFLKATNVNLPASTAASGNILKSNARFIHNYGADNTFVGVDAGSFGVTGADNVGVGAAALSVAADAEGNVAIGSQALKANVSGDYNIAIGVDALALNNSINNTAIGAFSLANNTGNSNVALGHGSAFGNTTGTQNTALGFTSLFANQTGSFNTAVGYDALAATTASQNTALGRNAGKFVTTGASNVIVGHNAGVVMTTGSNNIVLGADAGSLLTTGSNNIYLAAAGSASENTTIRIGSNLQTRAFISGVSGVTSTGGIAVFINASGQLGTATSSRAAKDTIADMEAASNRLMRLRPVTFYYREDDDPAGRHLQYGLIAEEVAKVAPELVARNAQGAPQTVYYQFLPPMLLNEYQKQQRTIERMGAEIAELRAQAARTTALLERLERDARPAR